MAAGPVEVKMEVTIKGGEISATLKFVNSGKEKFLLERANAAPDGMPGKQLVEVTTAKAEPVPYKGRTGKSPAPGPGDYLELPASGELVTSLRIDGLFAFPGPGQYVAKYWALNPGLGENEFVELTSASVSFRR